MSTQAVPQTLSQTFASFAHRSRFDDLPPHVVRASKRLLLDTLAVAWAGSNADGIERVNAVIAQSGTPVDPRDSSTLWGSGKDASPMDAAFINGSAAAALDYDALHIDAPIHSSIVTVPSLLAIAQSTHADGKSLLTALVVADEINCRLGLAAGAHGGWFYTSVFGVFGAAAGCARLLGLDEPSIGHAIGTALFQAGGTQQSMVEKALTKRFMSALAARAGVFSALLAKTGMQAPLQALEGQFGLFNLYEKLDESGLVRDLGSRFHSADISFKRFPSCGCSHSATEAALQLANHRGIDARQVERATVRVSPYMHRLVGTPFAPTEKNAQVTGQFSVQYAVACALVRRRFGIRDIAPASVLDPEVGDLARRVSVEVDPTNSNQLAPTELIVELKSGERMVQRIESFPGGTATTITDADLHAKVHDCMSHGTRPLSRPHIDAFIERIETLETEQDVAGLFG